MRFQQPLVYLGVAAVSAGVLLLELTLTRIYSVTQGYHFAFLAVSLGLLGFGASGTFLFLAPRLWREGRQLLLAVSAGLFSLTAIGSYWALDVIPFDAYLLVVEPSMFGYLALFYLVPVVPFLFAGLALGGALAMDPKRASGLYGTSLVGSGGGALLALGGPATTGPGSALATVAMLGAVGVLAFSAGRAVRGVVLAATASAGIVVVGLVVPGLTGPEMSQYKTLPRVLDQVGSSLEWTGWNAFSRVDLVSADALHQAPGLSFAYTGVLPRQSAITVDGDNLTSLTAATAGEATFTEFLPGAVAYGLTTAPRVLVIEPGGGLDVLTALHHGADEVVALIGNPLEANLLLGHASEASGGVFDDPRVTVVQTNPRTYLARHDGRFDVVVISLRDAFRPITAGAYSLSENYLYTTEAFGKYVEHLAPDGIVLLTRWAQLPPSEEMRAAAGLIEALEDSGTDVGNGFAAIRTLQTLTVVAKNGVFEAADLRAIRDFAESRRMDLAYLPDIGTKEANRYFVLNQPTYLNELRELIDRERRDDYYESRKFDVRPTTDNRPFFFHLFRWRQASDVIDRLGREWQPFGGAGYLVVLAFLVVAVAFSTLLILVPLVARGGSDDSEASAAAWRPLVYFVSLGASVLVDRAAADAAVHTAAGPTDLLLRAGAVHGPALLGGVKPAIDAAGRPASLDGARPRSRGDRLRGRRRRSGRDDTPASVRGTSRPGGADRGPTGGSDGHAVSHRRGGAEGDSADADTLGVGRQRLRLGGRVDHGDTDGVELGLLVGHRRGRHRLFRRRGRLRAGAAYR